ncbi:hypothetical protein TBR22_A24230 [Luteitalea sp. TBR-22]|uniref:sulfotransferase family protein n=1 Tax=Luteitalea sp. TBR-22 TaxID=2802971 RepID=UPI001AF4E07A|nr:sulfotransferase [Luteitalea sp. TBR-22]BCS33196.1 hypothetical protein TBR22_A24230 [Luteitalea sp. TBR-22]
MSQTPTEGRTHAPLLIMGSPRSGTTFLSQMVNRFLDIHICRDNGTLLRFHRNLAHYQPLSDDANLRRLIAHLFADRYFTERLRHRGMSLSEEELFARVPRRTYGGVIEAVFSATAATHGKSNWGYKRASFARVTGHQIDDLFPSARFVHCIRDARDVVLSMRTSTDLLLERSWHFGAVDWVSHLTTGRQLGARLGPSRYMEVRYEQFMATPAKVLTDIIDFTGGDAGAERLDRISSEIGALLKADNTEKWRKKVPPDAIRTIERVAGALLADLGYPVINPGVVGQPVGLGEHLALHADRIASNLFRTQFGVMARYRWEVVKGHARARLGRR